MLKRLQRELQIVSFRQVTEVKLDRVRPDSGLFTGGLTSQLISPFFGWDNKIEVPCLDEACIVVLN